MSVDEPFNIYREQLSSHYHGLALWDPKPVVNLYKQPGHVSIGDVGYLDNGAFMRMFNVTLPWDDPSNKLLGNEGRYEHINLSYPDNVRDNEIREGVYYGPHVSEVDNVGADRHEDSMGQMYQCRAQHRGALLSLPHKGHRRDVIPIKVFENYIRDNVDNWFRWSKDMMLPVEHMEDLIFVTGCTLVTSWAAAAFDGRLSLDYTPTISLEARPSVGGGAQFFWRNIRGNLDYHNSHFDPDVQGPLPQNQCVFIRGFRAKRTFFRTRLMRAAAEPLPDDPDDRREDGIEVSRIPDGSNYRDPLSGVLDYIEEKCREDVPAAEDITIITHDDDLQFIKGVETLTADAVENFLREKNVPLLIENGAAILKVVVPMDVSEPSPSSPPTIVAQDSDSASVTTTPRVTTPLDPAEFSTKTKQVDTEVVVASGDTRYTRKQLRLVNNLHDIGLDLDIDLPIIAVIGSQSSGKSSLIHATSGVPLPKAPGDACTRCPIECRLMRGDTWLCRVFLRRYSSGGANSSELSKERFGDDITDGDSVKDRVERAQLAILNPSLPAETFLDANADLTIQSELSFSNSIVCLEITGPEYSDISFVDLPGLIRNVGTCGNPENIQLIEDLAVAYISKPNCIILVTITCETDFANQGAYGLARDHDPQGLRTVGVLTKPDRSPEAAHEQWVRFVGGETEQLRHGWFCVKLHDTETAHPQPTLREAREYEDHYFNKEFVWRRLRARNRLGTKKLVQHLEETLSDLISNQLIDLSLQIRNLEEETTNQLESLGKPPSDDSIGEINALINRLVHDLEVGIEQRGREDGNLLYLIEDEAIAMKKKLRETCPDFRAWREGTKEPSPFIPIPDILLEDGDPPADKGTREIKYLDEMIEKKTRSSARGLPDGGQSEVAESYLRSITEKWAKPTNEFVKRATDTLRSFIEKAIRTRCEHLSYHGLHGLLLEVVDGHLRECHGRTQIAINMLLKLERSGHTRNDFYYREYKDKFLSHFKLQRELAGPSTLLRDLNNIASSSGAQPGAQFVNHVNQAISALGKAGFSGISPLQLAKLLSPLSSDPALEDMAAVCAGFEVALHRFVDYVPLIVDTELVQGVCQGLATILRRSFRFNDPDGAERCSEFLRESAEVQERREYLKQRKRRLALAIVELTDFPFWAQAQ